MNLPEQMYTDLKSQLPALTDALKAGVEYGGELFHRFIQFDIWMHVFDSVLIFILTVLSITIFYQMYKRSEWGYDGPQNFAAWASIGFGCVATFLSIVFPIILFENTQIILKDIFVPELRVIEILSDLTTQ